MKKIGILGYWSGYNYGSELTNYATFLALKRYGYDINMYDIALGKETYSAPPLFSINPYPDGILHGRYPTKDELRKINDDCDIFITTSDQQLNHWVYKVTGKTAALDFIKSNKRKIAYAASYGHADLRGTEEDRATMSHFLREIDFFSVREKSAVSLSKKYFGVDATFVLDPVFLIKKTDYEKLAEKSNIKLKNEKFIFAYILDINDEWLKLIKEYKKEYKLNCIIVTDATKDKNKDWSNYADIIEKDLKIEDWIKFINESSFYITDSFHGTCLGIILKKQFITLVNKNRGKTRFDSILSTLMLENRMAINYDEAYSIIHDNTKIDYNNVNNILNKYIDFSISWLINAIEQEIPIKCYSTYDLITDTINDLKLKNSISNIDNNNNNQQIIDNIILQTNKFHIYRKYYKSRWLGLLPIPWAEKHRKRAAVLHELVRRIRRSKKEFRRILRDRYHV